MNEESRKAGNPKAAFPVYAKDDGMTLRDYFAAKALQGLVASDCFTGNYSGTAYAYADAMLAEREKQDRRSQTVATGEGMNDTQRLDWLERNPERLLTHYRAGDTHKFSILVEKGETPTDPDLNGMDPKYSPEYETLREALDEGMKCVL